MRWPKYWSFSFIVGPSGAAEPASATSAAQGEARSGETNAAASGGEARPCETNAIASVCEAGPYATNAIASVCEARPYATNAVASAGETAEIRVAAARPLKRAAGDKRRARRPATPRLRGAGRFVRRQK